MGRRALAWLRDNLFSSWLNGLLTVLALYVIYRAAAGVYGFAVAEAVWRGADGAACRESGGACWPFIWAKLDQFLYGRYPETERWRAQLAGLLLVPGLAALAVPRLGLMQSALVYLVLIYPPLLAVLLAGGLFGLAPVETALWGGLMLTLIIALSGMTVSLPLGIVLALARRSALPVIRWLAIAFIEFWRGVPMVTVLFMASAMLPLFLPEGVSLDKMLRALIAVAVFASAYMAEVVRGGLQSIPAGQREAARSLGLNGWQVLSLVILPQALRNVIPGIVNTFIGLFKNTTLVLIIGLFDFLGMIQAALADPHWFAPTVNHTAYLFAGLVFWVFCFGLSRSAHTVEKRLSRGEARVRF